MGRSGRPLATCLLAGGGAPPAAAPSPSPPHPVPFPDVVMLLKHSKIKYLLCQKAAGNLKLRQGARLPYWGWGFHTDHPLPWDLGFSKGYNLLSH